VFSRPRFRLLHRSHARAVRRETLGSNRGSETSPDRPRESERPRRRSLSNPAIRGVAQSVSPPTSESFDFDVGVLDKLPARSRSPPPRTPASKSVRSPRSRPPQGRPQQQPQQQRPSAQFASAPQARGRSIFGDEAISEQTLDEVILSYLAEDLDGGSNK
jgi:hypothetical protein